MTFIDTADIYGAGTNEELVGRLLAERRDEVEVAYMIDKAYWRRGLATEAARGIRDYAFNQLGLSRLICMIDGQNAASIGVAEAIGMTFEKEVVDEHGPYLIYSMTKPASP